MNWKRTLGVWTASALLILGLSVNVDASSDLCPALDSGKIDTVGDPATVTFTAPAGYLITSYCVKAGTEAVFVTVDPPASSVTIDHPVKDSVSHYSVAYTNGQTTTTYGETTTSADTTTTSESTSTSVDQSSTTTIRPSTSTSTSTPPDSTSTSLVSTTTAPIGGSTPIPANWSAGNTCDTVSVQFGAGIHQVDAYANGGLIFTFDRPGTREAVVGAPMVIQLVPIMASGFEAVPPFVEVTVEKCAPGPSEPAAPTTPDGGESLPFTGFDSMLPILAGALLLSGVGLVAWKGRSE